MTKVPFSHRKGGSWLAVHRKCSRHSSPLAVTNESQSMKIRGWPNRVAKQQNITGSENTEGKIRKMSVLWVKCHIHQTEKQNPMENQALQQPERTFLQAQNPKKDTWPVHKCHPNWDRRDCCQGAETHFWSLQYLKLAKVWIQSILCSWGRKKVGTTLKNFLSNIKIHMHCLSKKSCAKNLPSGFGVGDISRWMDDKWWVMGEWTGGWMNGC